MKRIEESKTPMSLSLSQLEIQHSINPLTRESSLNSSIRTISLINLSILLNDIKCQEEYKDKLIEEVPLDTIDFTSFMDKDDGSSPWKKLKEQLIPAPLLAPPEFNEYFEVDCNASGISIGGNSIAYYSENLECTCLNYLNYDGKLNDWYHVLQFWQHHLWPSDIVNKIDHESSIRYMSQDDIDMRHDRWIKLIETFPTKSVWYIVELPENYSITP